MSQIPSHEMMNMLYNLQDVTFYPIHVFTNNQLIYPDYSDTSNTYRKDMDPFFTDPDLYQNLSQNTGYLYEPDNSNIFYTVGKKDAFVCIIGPLCLRTLFSDQMFQYARRHQIKQKIDFKIQSASIQQALKTLTLVFYLLGIPAPEYLSEDAPVFYFTSRNIEKDSDNARKKKEFDLQAYKLSVSEKDIPHLPYELEMEILSALQTSDEEKFYSMWKKSENYASGEFANSSSKYKEYSVVSLITIFTRAAIAGGVSQTDAYSLSDILIYKTSLCRNEQNYLQIFREAVVGFFDLVKNNKGRQNQSLHIRNCKAYIDHHLNKELSPDILADHLGISKNYLLNLFHKYENITLMQYILRERVQAAANMLKYSDYEIVRIASYFHFKSQSHFGVVFKKYIGMSPAEYRKKNKPVSF